MLHHKGDAVVYHLTESCENGVNVYGIKGHDLEYRSLCTDRDAVAHWSGDVTRETWPRGNCRTS